MWKFNDAFSIIIALEDEVRIGVNKTALKHIKSKIENICDEDINKLHKVSDLMDDYELEEGGYDSEDEKRFSKGDILFFFGWVPHRGSPAVALKNKHIHIYISTHYIDIPNNEVALIDKHNVVTGKVSL